MAEVVENVEIDAAEVEVEAPAFHFVVTSPARGAVPDAEEEVVVPKKRKAKRKHREGEFKNEIQKKPFQELVRDIAAQTNGGNAVRIAADAFELIQMAAEGKLVEIFADTQKICTNRGAKTIQLKDFNLAIELRRDSVLQNYTPSVPENKLHSLRS